MSDERCSCRHAVEHHDAHCLPPFSPHVAGCHHSVSACSQEHCSWMGCGCVAFEAVEDAP